MQLKMQNLKCLIPLVTTSVMLVGCSSSTAEPATTEAPDNTTPVVEPKVEPKEEPKEEPILVDPSIPVLTLSFTPTKAFRFTWAEVPDATSYKIKEAVTVASGFDTTSIVDTTDITTRSFDHIVPLYTRLNAKYILYSCLTADDCTPSAEVHTSTRLTDMASSIGYFKASNTDAGDLFGSSVSLSKDGNTLAVGAYGEASSLQGINGTQDNDTAKKAGAVYVFIRNNTSAAWSQQAYLKAYNAEVGDHFGISVSLSADGNTLAVGAAYEDSGSKLINTGRDSFSASAAGAAYVFTRNNTTWDHHTYLKASKAGTGDQFGTSVSLSADGHTLAVSAGSENSDDTGVGGDGNNDRAPFSGAVYVFAYSDTGWSEQAYLKASNAQAYDFFGNHVSISADGNTLAVGALGESSNEMGVDGVGNNNSAIDSGAVYVFTRALVKNKQTWSEQAYLKASNAAKNHQFGSSVSISADGNTLAVGALSEGSNAIGIANNLAPSSGAVYVFIRKLAVWSEQAHLKASNIDAYDLFGSSVSISANGNTLAVSASGESSNAAGIHRDQANNGAADSGAVYTFTRSDTTWSQQAYIKASNPGADDEFGFNLALSADGGTLAVAATSEGSNTKGINEDKDNNDAEDAGAVYVY